MLLRDQLYKLIKNTIIFQYTLPCNEKSIPKIKHSTLDDFCYASISHHNLVNIIYNSIIEYSFNSQEITLYDYSSLHARALKSKLKYDEEGSEENKLKYGFYGEVLLDCILKVFHRTHALIARGYFYNPLENSETKGYDSFHIIENERPELWFGETKFYGDYENAMENSIKSVMNKIEIALSDKYLQNNLIAICEKEENFESANQDLRDMVVLWKKQPDVNLPKVLKDKNFKLVYPVMILYDDLNMLYDDCIQKAVSYLNEKISEKHYNLSIDYEIFFILIPLTNSQQIKKDVIKWISEKKPVMS